MAVSLHEQAKKSLAAVPEEYVFWCRDGQILRTMKDLAEALETMSDETFSHHVNAEKNDFANWVRDILKDEKLARDLARSNNRGAAAKAVRARETSLTARLT
jgi:hypothetical protein